MRSNIHRDGLVRRLKPGQVTAASTSIRAFSAKLAYQECQFSGPYCHDVDIAMTALLKVAFSGNVMFGQDVGHIRIAVPVLVKAGQ